MFLLLSNNLDKTGVLIDDSLCSLNAALMHDAIKITVSSGVESDKPIGILFENDKNLNNYVSNFRCIIEVKDNATVSIIHAHTEKIQAPHFTNSVVQMDVGENSHIEFLRLQDFSVHQTLIEKSVANLGCNANLNYTSVDIGAQLMRADIVVNFNEKHANANINGVYIAGDNQHIDNHILSKPFYWLIKKQSKFLRCNWRKWPVCI